MRVSGRQLTAVVVAALAVASGLSLAFAVRDGKGTPKSPGPGRPKVKPAPETTRSTATAAVRSRPPRGDRESTTTGAAVDAWRAPLAQALAGGVRAAERGGGSAAAAAWVVGWGTPILVGDDRLDRMWSISKPVAALATLEANHDSPASGLDHALTAAIQRSDNCAERGVVLTLQAADGADTATRFDDVLSRAGVAPAGPLQVLPPSEDGPYCPPLLQRWGIPESGDSAPGFGTYSWTLKDAVSFAHALADGEYGNSGATVLGLMRLQKRYGLEPDAPADYTGPLDWPPSGGTFPASWDPAYKGGWGGHAPRPGFPAGDFMAAQIVVLRVGGHSVALAARFWPSQEPTSDDPGITAAPGALHDLFARVQMSLATLAAGEHLEASRAG
jgi:hypothetical protein